jgi:hypothetical protein
MRDGAVNASAASTARREANRREYSPHPWCLQSERGTGAVQYVPPESRDLIKRLPAPDLEPAVCEKLSELVDRG